jgi:GAF domain-containing protein
MRRGAKPAKAKVEAKLPAVRKARKNEAPRVRQLQERLEAALQREAEALEQQTATSEILRVISSSPSDIQPVFDAIAANAARLCDAVNGLVIRFDGQLLHLAAHHNVDPERLAAVKQAYPRPPSRGALSGRAILTRAVVHVPDVSKDPEYSLPAATTIGYRSVLAVPMMHEGIARGTILVARDVVAPFSDTHIALIQTFADQAVIAIENARLFNETKEALEQQTATAEILRAISSSPTDLRPVLETVVHAAARFCDAPDVAILRTDQGMLRGAAAIGPFSEEMIRRAGSLDAVQFPISRETVSGRSVVERRSLHVHDLAAEREDEYPIGRDLQRRFGHRTLLSTPLLREGVPIGVMVLFRTEVHPFSDKQVRLSQTFADQAVIAIENVRLFTELEARNQDLTESLTQQTATAEILRVISSSPTDIQPVLDAITESAARLCEAIDTAIFLEDGEELKLATHQGPIALGPVGQFTVPMVRGTLTGRAALERRTIQLADHQAETVDYPEGTAVARRLGVHTMLVVPLLRSGRAIGVIALRRTEVRLFSDQQIALLQTFADQAVIAIENVRLFTELHARNHDLTEALEQQTATSEILQVISSSPTDLQPVFSIIAESAARLCGAEVGVVTRLAGDWVELKAVYGSSPDGADALRGAFPMRPTGVAAAVRAIRDAAIAHIPDVLDDAEYGIHDAAIAAGFRAALAVPLLRDGRAIGSLGIGRSNAGEFSERQVKLLSTFADQALIAIENVRLFTELEARNQELTDSLTQQTATAEILRVISSSPTDIQPVLDAVLESAARLCEAVDSQIFLLHGDVLRQAAHRGPIRAGRVGEYEVPIIRGTVNGRAMLEARIVHVHDLASESTEFPEGSRIAREFGHRTALCVPLLREGVPVGTIAIRRDEVRPFSERQIALVQTFADQAVIAIENVRLFTELGARNRDLTESLDQQTATSEILRVISQSPTDMQPVFDAIARNVRRLCGTNSASVLMVNGAMIHLAAVDNDNPEGAEALRQAYPSPVNRRTAGGRAILTGRTVHITDVLQDPDYEFAGLQGAGLRSVLCVPMLRHGTAIGAIVAHTWAVPRPFGAKQMELLQTFADQAVIAVENARLFRELEERTTELTRSVQQLTALGEISRAVSSTLDVETVLQTVVSRASQLAGSDGGAIYEYDEATQAFHIRATHNLDPALVGTLRAAPLHRGEGAMGRAAETREPVQIADIQVGGAYQSHIRNTLLGAGYRALLSVPLLREDQIIGSLSLNRKAPGEFSAEVVEVLKTFATQSALAIQNARLFGEIEVKSRQLEAASQHKSEFLANMSHELRTPLNAIIGFSEVLNERMFGELNEKQDEYLKDIHASGTHLLSLINDILDLSKIEAGRMELELSDFQLPAAIEGALTLVRERASRRDIDLRPAVAPEVGEVRADERKVRQVLLNLLSNAIKFTPEGGRIEVKAVTRDGVAEVSVSDTGIGIAPEDLEAVFEEFRQVGSSASKQQGTGLGLTLCRKFIELHGGRIWATSTVGAGSTFRFRLPIHPHPGPLPQ